MINIYATEQFYYNDVVKVHLSKSVTLKQLNQEQLKR